MDKESNTSSLKENCESNKIKIKKESNLSKKPLQMPIIIEKHKSANEAKIKFSHPIKHFSSLQDLNFRDDVKISNLKSSFTVDKENAFGYRILFEAFNENMDKKKKSLLEDKENEGVLLESKLQRKTSDSILEKKRSSTFSQTDLNKVIPKITISGELKQEESAIKKDNNNNKKICKTSRERDEKAKSELNEYMNNIQHENEKKINEDIFIGDINHNYKNISSIDLCNIKINPGKPSFKNKKSLNKVSSVRVEDGLENKNQSKENKQVLSSESSLSEGENDDGIDSDRFLSESSVNNNKCNFINNEKSEEIIYENQNPMNFNNLLREKIFGYKTEMLDFLDNARNEVEKLYDDLYEKTADIANRKARRISLLYNKNFPFRHSNSEQIKQTIILDSNLLNNLDLKSSVSQPFKFNPIFKSNDNTVDKDSATEISDINRVTTLSEFETINKDQTEDPNMLNSENNNNPNNDENFDYYGFFEEEAKEKEITKIKDFATKNFIEKIKSMFDLQQNLKLSLTQNFELTKNFLANYDLNSNNPLQEYVDLNAKEICDSWLLPKIDFENLNMNSFINNKEIPVTFKNFIVNEESKNKFTSYFIERTKNTKGFEFERKILKNNYSFLNKLELINLESKADLKKVFYEEQINKLNFEKMKKIKFEKSKLDNINYLFFFPNLAKLYFKSCLFIDMPSHFAVNFAKLKQVNFKNCYLNNENVRFLMNEFQSLANLELINLSRNCITNFSFIPKSQFKKLHSLILRKNKISRISINKEIIAKYYPKLDFLDLCSNNICSLSNLDFENFEKEKDHQAIILLGKNLILHNNANIDKIYAKYLISSLSNSNANMFYVDLSFLFYKFKKDSSLNIHNLKLNLNIQINLRKLDLSFNGLTDADLYNFFSENKGLVNLNKIKLRNNSFTEKILEIFLKMNSQNLFEYLKTIDLSGNSLDISCLEILTRVIDDNKNLSKIIISSNPIIEHIELFLSNKASPLNRFCLKSFFDHIEEISKKHKRKLKIKYY